MTGLGWSWLAAPYVLCTLAVVAVAIATALVRGDRVLRIGMIGAAASAIPWCSAQALAACTTDAETATRILRLGQGPVAMVGPNLLLVLLGVAGQLERHRWIARTAFAVGVADLALTWATRLVVPGVQLLPAGMYYVAPGPLTGVHLTQLLVWLGIGLVIARRSAPRGERRRQIRFLFAVFIAAAIGSLDTLLLYGIWGSYPVAWLPATIAAGIALYVVLRTDLLRSQGFDRGVALELGGFAAAVAVSAVLAIVLRGGTALAISAIACSAWIAITAIVWGIARTRPVRVAAERALDQFVARVATTEAADKIAERLTTLWRKTIGFTINTTWWADGDTLVAIGRAERWKLPIAVIEWLVLHPEAIAVTDLATMRLGAIRPALEAVAAMHGTGWIVPLVDRDELVGIVEAGYDKALREDERGLVAESARAAARALTFVALSQAAARERETAREVEIADALRLQAAASRDAELGRWVVAAEYKSAARTTGAGWSAIELDDGRLALLATEAQAHGVAAALATAALSGAFAAATRGNVTLPQLLEWLAASAEGVMRGGEPVAAFIAVLDAQAQMIEWACAGHPGAFLVGPIATIDTSLPAGSVKSTRPDATQLGGGTRAPGASLSVATRGKTPLPPDTLLVVASSALRGDDDAHWRDELRDQAPASGRLASVLVQAATRRGPATEDLLAVVVRSRDG